MSGLSVSDIISELTWYDGLYKKAAVDAAIEQKDEVVPELIQRLIRILDDPYRYLKKKGYFLHVYASIILGHLKVKDAHEIIIALCSLPGELSAALYGDILNTDLPMVFLRTSGGDPKRIMELVRDKEADLYCRDAALKALMNGVIKNIFERAMVLEFIGSLFTGEECEEDSDFWSIVALHANDLYPEEIIDTIKQAYEKKLISPNFIDYEEFEHVLSNDREEWLKTLLEDPDENSFEDIHSVMEWWDCFNLDSIMARQQQKKQVSPEDRKTKKKKKKMAANSQRKNRKKK
ncbi:DUF1186 domain-containing protein [Desulforegula conservatrix]|uniref:DUF1186 domain-containing protein n=1 Tax=Desulforegula conservatrix TaxID=153026 RepID=UPI00040A7E50|nr:DUF1186 domain-containing protein [Desulforegula conservatrix]